MLASPLKQLLLLDFDRMDVPIITLNMHLCGACQSLRPHLRRYSNEYETVRDDFVVHQWHWLDMMRSLDEGCFICSLMWTNLTFGNDLEDLELLRPASYCIAGVNEESPDRLANAWIRFYSEFHPKQRHGMELLKELRCFSLSSGRCTLNISGSLRRFRLI